MRKLFKAMVSGAVAVGLVLIGSPALADNVYLTIFNGGGQAMGTCMVSNKDIVYQYFYGTVTDVRADGVGIYGRFKLKDGTITDVIDPDGSGSRIGEITTPSYFLSFQCVARDGHATGWKDVWHP